MIGNLGQLFCAMTVLVCVACITNKYEYVTVFFLLQFYVSPKLALLGLCIVPPVAIMSRIYGRYLRNITKAVQDSLAAATTVRT